MHPADAGIQGNGTVCRRVRKCSRLGGTSFAVHPVISNDVIMELMGNTMLVKANIVIFYC
jgi:hypothetical protein